MVNELLPPPLFDFGKVSLALDASSDENAYHLGLLETRNIAEESALKVFEGADPEVIAKALDDQLRHEPVRGMRGAILDGWVRRAYHFKTKVVPALAIAALGAGLYVADKLADARSALQAETKVERSAHDLIAARNELSSDIEKIATSPEAKRLPADEQELLAQDLHHAREFVKTGDGFVVSLTKKGTLEETINQGNYSRVDEEGAHYSRNLESARGHLSSAKAVLKAQREIADLSRTLDSYRDRISTWSDSPFQASAQAALTTAQASLGRRNAESAKKSIELLEQTEKDNSRFGNIRENAARAYNAIVSAGCPASATKPAMDIYARFQAQLQQPNLEVMAKDAQKLEGISSELLSAYELRVVGGLWIYQNDNPSQKNHYLKIQAIADRPVFLPIKDDDRNGTVTLTSNWGEEVPIEVYNAVGADKRDNGVINNYHFGQKSACSTAPTYSFSTRLENGDTFTFEKSASRMTPINPNGDLTLDANWR